MTCPVSSDVGSDEISSNIDHVICRFHNMVDKMWAVTFTIFAIFSAAHAQNQVPAVIWGNSG